MITIKTEPKTTCNEVLKKLLSENYPTKPKSMYSTLNLTLLESELSR